MKNNYLDSKLITIKGLVQGVGFRPFIYRLAKEMHIYGWVRNNNESVEIFIEADENIVNNFVKKIYSEKPITSSISSLEIKEVSFHGFDNFQIIESNDNTNNVTQVSPDIAVCEECLQDLKNNSNRINYPLINCSVCGPRYTIVKSLPYDRINTTMSAFKMCKQCYEEYSNPSNRRFHAQPIGCNHCGPQYSLKIYNKDTNDYKSIDNFNDIFKYISDGLKKNKIFCFKATGGYNLVCDAKNEESVDILRHIKNRDSKPFAVMFRDINTLKNYAKVDEIEFQQLISWQRPIVILKEQEPLAYSVSMGLGTIGAILPYMPFHYLLFEYSEMEALVMTSGNISDEPITIDDNKALSLFGKITDGVLLYNRDIYNRVDDSVVFVCNSTPYFIRRSRGFVPTPINLNIDCEGVFAAGAELTSCFSIGKGNEAILSPYIGDLKNFETYLFYDEVFKRYSHLFRFKPSFVAVDLHPNYHSTIYGTEIGVDTISVQHHYAHILSVMAEHNIVEPIIGVAFDGTGLGTDDKIWGSEFMVCTPYDFKRIGHFDYIPLPGGDKVVYEPWRTGVSLLYKIFGEKFLDFDIPINKKIGRQQIENIIKLINSNTNSPLSCSAGRLFDAIAAILGVCTKSSYHAEAPMKLESLISNNSDNFILPFDINNYIFSYDEMIVEILDLLKKGYEVDGISRIFHNTVIKIIVEITKKISEQEKIYSVALSGGTFQNKFLLRWAVELLKKEGFAVYLNTKVPSNDGGIALGQLYNAAFIRNFKK